MLLGIGTGAGRFLRPLVDGEFSSGSALEAILLPPEIPLPFAPPLVDALFLLSIFVKLSRKAQVQEGNRGDIDMMAHFSWTKISTNGTLANSRNIPTR